MLGVGGASVQRGVGQREQLLPLHLTGRLTRTHVIIRWNNTGEQGLVGRDQLEVELAKLKDVNQKINQSISLYYTAVVYPVSEVDSSPLA